MVARLLAHIPNFYEENEPYEYLEQDYIKIADFDPEEYFMVPNSELKEENFNKLIREGAFPLAREHGAADDDD